MFNQFGKESMDDVETLNKGLGTRHRTKPYDLNNPDDVRQALILAVAAYRDYDHYRTILAGLSENFDESLENFDAATWIQLSAGKGNPDTLAADCESSLNFAASSFDKIADRARENLAMIIKSALSLTSVGQNDVFGRAYKVKPEGADAQIEALLEMLCEVEYQYSIPDNFESFLKYMEDEWADFIK